MRRTKFRAGALAALSIGALVITGGLVTGATAASPAVDSWMVL